MKKPTISQFSGKMKKMRIVSGFSCYGARQLAYDETEKRITINDPLLSLRSMLHWTNKSKRCYHTG
jgi:hypothetical protein